MLLATNALFAIGSIRAEAVIDFQIRAAINDPGAPSGSGWRTGASGSFETATETLPEPQLVAIPATPDGASLPGPSRAWNTATFPNVPPIAAEIRGTIRYTLGGDLADAFCSLHASDPLTPAKWRAHRWPDPRTGQDAIAVKLRSTGGAIVPLAWQPVDPYPAGSAAGDPECSRQHLYVATLPESAPYNLFFDNQFVGAANSGSTLRAWAEYARALPVGNGTWRMYKCDKQIQRAFGASLQPYGIDRASLLFDTRRQPFGNPMPKPEAPYWTESGYDGAYTCNWAEKGARYRVYVSGVRKWDQTTPAGFAEADAWCATAWPQGPSQQRDRYMPHYYKAVVDSYFRPLGATDADLEPYGNQWKPKRFDIVSPKTGKWLNPLGARINNVFVRWNAVNPDANGCDPNHTYYVDLPNADVSSLAPGAPILFSAWDFWEYYEWDNCGAMSIQVERIPAAGPYDAPAPAQVPAAQCKWEPAPWSKQAYIIDDPTNESNGLNYQKPWHCENAIPGQPAQQGNDAYPACFWPQRVSIEAIPKGPGRDTPVTTALSWSNESTFHSVTSWCRPEAPRQKIDWMAEPECAGTVFDSHPACKVFVSDGSWTPAGCTKNGDWFACTFGVAATNPDGSPGFGVQCSGSTSARTTKAVPATLYPSPDSAERASGYFTIPWFCRVSPQMRGTLVVSTNDAAIA